MCKEEMALLQTVIGGLIALGGSFGATWFAKHLEHRTQSKQLAMAIKGELQGIIHIVTLRNYQAILRNIVTEIRQTKQALVFTVTVEQEYTQIYKSNSSKVGSLKGNLPTDIAIVYTQISSILDDFSYLNACAQKYGEKATYSPGPDDLIMRFSAMADLLDDTISKATLVCEHINKHYS